jgi:hypothetical protein
VTFCATASINNASSNNRNSVGKIMLIDELMANPLLLRSPTTELRGRLSKATKFVLRQDFAMAADELSNDFAGINRALPLCRLPFRECWFELLQADRQSFRTSHTSTPEIAVKRVGYFLSETDQIGSWDATCFWSWANGVPAEHASLPGLSAVTIQLDYARSNEDFRSAMSFAKAAWVPEYITLTDAINLAAPNLTLRAGGREQMLTGEGAFLAAMLALLNSRNASETVLVERHNTQRQRNGRPLLFNYHLIDIPQRYKQHMTADGDPSGHEVRAHFCRGHFKVRKTGVFFWSAHQRGNPSLGFVHHDYTVGLPP